MEFVKSAVKRMIGNRAEDGQAIVLIALFMVVMLAMVGVAIDGGGLFLLWRDAQNAADTSALQAAFDRCTTDDELAVDWITTGYEAANVNGFNNDGASNFVTVEEWATDEDYVHVIIHAIKPAYFIQLVYRGELAVTAEALVYCTGSADFSDLPGVVGLGGCTCSGVSNARVAVNVAEFKLVGSAHSNCDLKTSAATNKGTAGALTSFRDMTPGNVTASPAPKGSVTPPIELDEIIPIELYFPGGEIYEAIKNSGGLVRHETGDYIVQDSDGPLQGLWAVEGDFTIPNSWHPSGDAFGIEGLTVVSRTGTIEYRNTNRDDTNWSYYGYNVDNPLSSGHEGVTIAWSRGNGSAIAAYSGKNIADPANDGTEPPNDSDETCSGDVTGIQVLGTGDGPPPEHEPIDFDITGLIYAPWSHIELSGEVLGLKGPIIGWAVDMSSSGLCWEPEPDFHQPMAPVMNNADQN